jgi:hypothetical protein
MRVVGTLLYLAPGCAIFFILANFLRSFALPNASELVGIVVAAVIGLLLVARGLWILFRH